MARCWIWLDWADFITDCGGSRAELDENGLKGSAGRRSNLSTAFDERMA
jgi:hypothetical protein